MKAEVIRLDLEKENKKKGHIFRRLVLKGPKENGKHKIYFCDVVYGFRNYPRWKIVIQYIEKHGLPVYLGQLKLKDKKHVDADSFPVILLKI